MSAARAKTLMSHENVFKKLLVRKSYPSITSSSIITAKPEIIPIVEK